MDNYFYLEVIFKSTHKVDSRHVSLPCDHNRKFRKAESMMITCLDNHHQSLPCKGRPKLIKPELSLNRLFEIAKMEHMRKQKKN